MNLLNCECFWLLERSRKQFYFICSILISYVLFETNFYLLVFFLKSTGESPCSLLLGQACTNLGKLVDNNWSKIQCVKLVEKQLLKNIMRQTRRKTTGRKYNASNSSNNKWSKIQCVKLVGKQLGENTKRQTRRKTTGRKYNASNSSKNNWSKI